MGAKQVDICLSGGYYLHALKRLLKDLRPLFDLVDAREQAVVNVDMRRLTFLGPAALATTVALLMAARDAHLTLEGGHIYAPEAPRILRYLHKMEFFNVLFHAPPGERSDTEGLIECRHFMTDAEVRPVTRAIIDAIKSKTEVEVGAANALDVCFSEILENVGFHSDARYGGVAAVQAFKDELEVAMVDLGVGIAASLSKNADYRPLATDDLAAIQTALNWNVTSTPWRNKGWGLAFTEALLTHAEGRLVVRSGAGHVIRGPKPADKIESEHPFPGTLVAMRIKIGNPLDQVRAWGELDQFLDPELDENA